MGDHTLFFYGTLLAPPVLHRVIYGTSSPDPTSHPAMRYLTIRPALLRDYRRHRVASADYPAIIPEKGGTVRGSVVSGLTEGDVFRLDVFEGSQYTKGTVEVEVLEGVALDELAPEAGVGKAADTTPTSTKKPEMVTAQTYIWTDGPTWLDPREWDFEDFKKHKMRRWMGGGDSAWTDGDEEEAQDENVQEDEGFADVDEAVRELKAKEKKDPTGGRGVNGAIGRQLAEVQRNGSTK
ncbi:uncharacterized protein HMPREF1541_08976 [Cyphellophora europaea CBS 101466]|uniref:Putative gamma-glutamylcyclotransferase n=1 Tax=Cyphellophora europaea (strain CBS 101466) TaxID=1220924 RepID=W2RLW1_CYPE1|nr:uncharacterized protein HMPREF1541_08976 [Cyphellophora europaea CBS 101466]ETN36698.1 hypothetical protein HMPREF1541_08976 [Cyphellophora europaea CBS 101466]